MADGAWGSDHEGRGEKQQEEDDGGPFGDADRIGVIHR
jgi:hypothetical protein